ncbi:HisA/HisF-related TIM barrel protein [Methylocella tundrae]|uniref:Histidine biosynthesis protein n=1 Tax=Methylocella tundrae TaxID=227605 RepID=A0A4U8Z2H7_METTU|nr:HisA/HisF-related TIM barrel protein [Methylocella tundrae]WPP03514.1 HisA/HisF-related TIM barrel protein [Methylocella tundrae]VFU09614.1 Histidine biosynthesis protein [Methylocella tundrae]
MEVIPVIDLKGGVVVRARLGRRDSYAPIDTKLAPTNAPGDVVAGLLSLHPFQTIYIADLDAIESRGDHEEIVSALSEAFPQTAFWVDAGVADAAGARAWLSRHGRETLVLGSESLTGPAALQELVGIERLVLSLDFRGDCFVGPQTLLAAQHWWPSRVIVMTLARVGSHAGPDLDRLKSIVDLGASSSDDFGRSSVQPRVYAAGGVRGPEDLASLAKAGVEGVLVASALHDGQLTSADLDAARTI